MPTENNSSLLYVDYMPLKVKGAPVKTDRAYTVYGGVLLMWAENRLHRK